MGFAGISTWITSREDLILSKFVWARDTGSDVNDTSPEMDKMVAERYKLMTPDRRMRIASSMFETARAIIESSLPLNLTRRERRLAFAKRLYAGELPDAALLAFAEWNVREKLDEAVRMLDRGAVCRSVPREL